MRLKAKDYTAWHSYFTWWPTKVKDEWVWFERILRQGWRDRAGNKTVWRWSYVNSEFDLIKQLNDSAKKSVESGGSLSSGVNKVINSTSSNQLIKEFKQNAI